MMYTMSRLVFNAMITIIEGVFVMNRRKMAIIKLFCILSVVACVTFSAEAAEVTKKSRKQINEDFRMKKELEELEQLKKKYEEADFFELPVEVVSKKREKELEQERLEQEHKKEESKETYRFLRDLEDPEIEKRKEQDREKMKNAREEAFLFKPISGQPLLTGQIVTPMPKKQAKKTENKIVERKVDQLIQQTVNTDLFRAQKSNSPISDDYSGKPIELSVKLDTLIAAENYNMINRLYSSIGKSYQLASYWPVGTLIYNLRMNPDLRLDNQLINDAYDKGSKKTYTIEQLKKVLQTLEQHKLRAVKKLADEKRLVESK